MRVLSAVVVVLWTTACAQAAPPAQVAWPAAASPMAWAFGNTLSMVIPGQGYSSKRYINANGTWTEDNSLGHVAGKWTLKDGKVCYTQTQPEPNPGYDGLCCDPTPRKPGDSWKNIDPVTFNEIVITVVAGRN